MIIRIGDNDVCNAYVIDPINDFYKKIIESNDNVAMVEYKESTFKEFINKIKSIFRKNK